MFYARNVDDAYNVYIVPLNSDGTMPDIDASVYESYADGTIDYDGYITSTLNEPFVLSSDVDKYANIRMLVNQIVVNEEDGFIDIKVLLNAKFTDQILNKNINEIEKINNNNIHCLNQKSASQFCDADFGK